MQYYAKVNTADPRIGFVSVGEMLTDDQARTLGKEKLDELTARGVLAACAASPKAAPSPAPAGGAEETPDETPAETPEETPAETPEETPDETPDETPEDDDELPELELGDDIVNDQPEEKPNKGKGRKA